MKRYRFRAEARIICDTEVEVSADGYSEAIMAAHTALSAMDLQRWKPWQREMASRDAHLEPIAIRENGATR